jgi:hypothetical protein
VATRRNGLHPKCYYRFVRAPPVDSNQQVDVGLPSERIRTAAGRLEECSFASSSHRYGATARPSICLCTISSRRTATSVFSTAIEASLEVYRLYPGSCGLRRYTAHGVLYVYNNTLSHESHEEPIRKLVSQFAAIHYTDLMTGEFEGFFSRGGDFTLDVARKISRRLAVSGGSTKMLEE